MTDKEIIKALEKCVSDSCIGCPHYGMNVIGCVRKTKEDAIDLINRQQEIIANISKLIIDNTYPSFDKDGKPVSIWNADGYKRIEELLKTGCKKPVCMPGDKVYQFSNGEVYESTVKNIIYDCWHIAFEEAAIGKHVFLTKEEAEKAGTDDENL